MKNQVFVQNNNKLYINYKVQLEKMLKYVSKIKVGNLIPTNQII